MAPRERRRRQYKSGSVFQACSAAAGCPPISDGERPKHRCKGRWMGTFQAGFSKDGVRRRKTVTGKTEAEVKEKLLVKMKEVGAADGQEGNQRTTVKAWSKKWLLLAEKKNRPNTHTADIAATKWIVEAIGHRYLDQLHPDDIRAVHDAIEGSGRSSSTAKRYHGTLSRMLQAAAAEGHRIPPYAFMVKAPEADVNDRRDIPVPECLAILRVIATLPHGSRWLFALLQGPRQAEVLGLTWEVLTETSVTYEWQLQPLPYRDKHDRSKGFRVPRGYEVRQLVGQMHLVRPKSKAGWRVAPLVKEMSEALETWRLLAGESPHGLVWPALDGSPANENEDREEWHAIQGTACVGHPSGRYYTVHEARHATGTLLRAIGATEATRVAIMGHSSSASTKVYEHVELMGEMREALQGVATVLQLSQPVP